MATAPGYTVPSQVIEAFIAQAAQERGIDPNVALKVYRGEGATNWQSQFKKNGVQEPSFGPFQLYTGGGLGNKFEETTGLRASDPSTWKENVTFALDEAKKGGWGPWMGAKAAGITGFEGINGSGGLVASAGTGTGAPLSLAPQGATPAQLPALGQAMQLAQLFGGLGGQQQAPPAPTPDPLMALMMARRQQPPPQQPQTPPYSAAFGRRFYS